MIEPVVMAPGPGASFQIFLVGRGGGGRDGLASEASLISRGGSRGRVAVSPLKKFFFILSYFMCFLKPHEQLISAKIRYKN